MFIRLLFCWAILMAAQGIALADGFSVFPYFYSCASGVVDCTAFPKHFYGAFGMDSQPPPDSQGAFPLPYSVHVTASNSRGQIIGVMDGLQVPPSTGIYGEGGKLFCGSLCKENIFPVDINNNGFYVANDSSAVNGGNIPLLGFRAIAGPLSRFLDTASLDQQLGTENIGISMNGELDQVSGINDANQVLGTIDLEVKGVWQYQVRGVLSPFAVPEPSSIVLLLTVAGAFAFAAWRRKGHFLAGIYRPAATLRLPRVSLGQSVQ